MKVVKSVAGMKSLAREWGKEGKKIGFVPTMGYLHEGHLSLVRESKMRTGVTVVSIFVNPTQFGPNEDFKKYPRDLQKDSAYLKKAGVDCLFYPEAAEIYPPGYRTFVEVRGLEDRLCGKSRPGHFRGVATVVLKLFEIVRPDLAFFGAKDAQQVLIIGRMAADLDLDVDVVTCPLVREADGLAMSSRNTYLNPEERRAAAVLFRALSAAKAAFEKGERNAESLRGMMAAAINAEPLARLQYVSCADFDTLEELQAVQGKALLSMAVYVGKTRLIDNFVIE